MTFQSASRLSAALLVATASLSGCATKQDVRDLQSDIRMELRQISAEISARQDSLLAEFRFQTMQTQDTLQNASRELVDIRGTLLRELRGIADLVATLSELAGQNQASITQIRDEMRRAGGSRPTTSFGTGEDQLIPGADGDPDEAYDFAMGLYQRRSFVGAKAAFQDFLTKYPEDELAPLVYFNLGDIAEQEERFDDAISSFQRVGELFPNEDKVADALYRIGMIHMDRDNDDAARQAFQRVVNTYEGRESAFLEGIVELARQALRDLGG